MESIKDLGTATFSVLRTLEVHLWDGGVDRASFAAILSGLQTFTARCFILRSPVAGVVREVLTLPAPRLQTMSIVFASADDVVTMNELHAEYPELQHLTLEFEGDDEVAPPQWLTRWLTALNAPKLTQLNVCLRLALSREHPSHRCFVKWLHTLAAVQRTASPAIKISVPRRSWHLGPWLRWLPLRRAWELRIGGSNNLEPGPETASIIDSLAAAVRIFTLEQELAEARALLGQIKGVAGVL